MVSTLVVSTLVVSTVVVTMVETTSVETTRVETTMALCHPPHPTTHADHHQHSLQPCAHASQISAPPFR